MNNLNMDGWNRLIFIPISPLYSFPILFPFPFPFVPFFPLLSPFPFFFDPFFLSFFLSFFPFSHIFLRSMKRLFFIKINRVYNIILYK